MSARPFHCVMAPGARGVVIASAAIFLIGAAPRPEPVPVWETTPKLLCRADNTLACEGNLKSCSPMTSDFVAVIDFGKSTVSHHGVGRTLPIVWRTFDDAAGATGPLSVIGFAEESRIIMFEDPKVSTGQFDTTSVQGRYIWPSRGGGLFLHSISCSPIE